MILKINELRKTMPHIRQRYQPGVLWLEYFLHKKLARGQPSGDVSPPYYNKVLLYISTLIFRGFPTGVFTTRLPPEAVAASWSNKFLLSISPRLVWFWHVCPMVRHWLRVQICQHGVLQKLGGGWGVVGEHQKQFSQGSPSWSHSSPLGW